jgi:hypothetical protein
MMMSGMQTTLLLVLVALALVGAQRISQPQPSLPVESYSDDPLVTSAAQCTLRSILASESAPHAIGPLTIQPGCMSATMQPHATSSVNAQTLPSSGIATIFGSTTSIASQTQTQASQTSMSSATSPTSATSTAPPQSSASGGAQTNAAPKNGWVQNQNIAVVLLTTFALLAGVTYFLDELLTLLV